VEIARLRETVARLRKRIEQQPASAPADLTALVKSLLEQAKPAAHLKWIRASVGNVTRLIHTDDILFIQSDNKYTRIVCKGADAFVRTPISELREGLDPERFWQVHRGAIVNAHAIDRAVREESERLVLHFRGHHEKIVVSRQYYPLFKQD
jgi:DNA-binding LytR/AlgR family response regulator